MTNSELEEMIRMTEAHTEAAPDEAIDGCHCQRCAALVAKDLEYGCI